MLFSCLYSPGATNAQSWYKINGMLIKIAVTMESLKGVKKGDATSVQLKARIARLKR